MAAHNETGRKGEEAACIHLARKGYRILERNWRHERLEVDIIAEHRGVIAVIEVKASKNAAYDDPVNRVNLQKRLNLIKAANAYIRINRIFQNVRFDVIAVVGDDEPYKVEHFENAFTVVDAKAARGW